MGLGLNPVHEWIFPSTGIELKPNASHSSTRLHATEVVKPIKFEKMLIANVCLITFGYAFLVGTLASQRIMSITFSVFNIV